MRILNILLFFFHCFVFFYIFIGFTIYTHNKQYSNGKFKFITTFMRYFSYWLPQQNHYTCYYQTFISISVSCLCLFLICFLFLSIEEEQEERTCSIFSIRELDITCEMSRHTQKKRSTNETHDQSRWEKKFQTKNVYTNMFCVSFYLIFFINFACLFLHWF